MILESAAGQEGAGGAAYQRRAEPTSDWSPPSTVGDLITVQLPQTGTIRGRW